MTSEAETLTPESPITYEVSYLGSPEGREITYPSYVLVAPLHWGVLRLREGRQASGFETDNHARAPYDKHGRVLNYDADGVLTSIIFHSPGLGVNIDELPEDEAVPTREALERFFEEHDIFIGKKTPEQIREEFDTRSDRWVAHAKAAGSPDFRHPDYEAILQLESAVISQMLVRLDRDPALWRYALMHVSGENPAEDRWDHIKGEWILKPDDETRQIWIDWGLRNGFLTDIPPQ